MRISKRSYYGLRALATIASADSPLSVRELAEVERMPENFLEKILQTLRRASIVDSRKGTDGGYTLARNADDISVWEVLLALDGPLRTFSPPVRSGSLPCSIPSHCQTNRVWRALELEIERTLSRITIATLVNPHR